jgi:hypothetical protein
MAMFSVARYLYEWARYLCLWGRYYAATAVAWLWVRLTRPWVLARFDAAWVEYQRGDVYRERLVNFGLGQAIYGFFNSKWERQYCLKLRMEKEPWLRFKIFFMPFSVPIPEELVAASREGYFDPDVKKRLKII